jgi:hypothetical protein
MRVIPTEAPSSVISVYDIDPKKHIVVAELDGNVCIGHYGNWGRGDKFRFFVLNDGFTKGNHLMKQGSFKEVVTRVLQAGGTVEAFDDYKQALVWIVKNGRES